MASVRAGELVATVLLALLPLWFFFKAWRAETRSLRLANLALGCGLLMVVRPERVLPLQEGTSGTGLLIARLVLVLVAAVGFVLSVLAMRARGSDGGTGTARPVIALLLCLLLGFTNVGTAMVSWGMNPENNKPWEWTSAQRGYRLRLPSSTCVESRMENAEAAFVCRVQRMQAAVFTRPADAAGYATAIAELNTRMRDSSNEQDAPPVIEETRTEAGWSCTRATVTERASNGHGPVMTSIALIHWPERELLFTVMIEGELWASSDGVRQVLRETFQKAARGIHLSLGP
ncbi:MAG TPA: hypothetical protein VGB96_04260, partial [Archangium sp.]